MSGTSVSQWYSEVSLPQPAGRANFRPGAEPLRPVYFRIVLDDFRFEVRRSELIAQVELRTNPAYGNIGPLGQELMLELAHGVCSWLIGQKIPLLQVDFACPRRPHAFDNRYFFSGPMRFCCDATLMRFSAAFLDMPIRQSKRK